MISKVSKLPRNTLHFFERGESNAERRKSVKKFSKMIDNNPDIEEMYMKSIRLIAELNTIMMDGMYSRLVNESSGKWSVPSSSTTAWYIKT